MRRAQSLLQTFVALADTLVDGYDVIDLMQTLTDRCVELLDVSAAAIALADRDGRLQPVACSDGRMSYLQLRELQLEEGPSFDATRTRAPVVCRSREQALARWPRFAQHTHDDDFVTISAMPMSLREHVIGALSFYSSNIAGLGDDLNVAQAMADIATIGILQARQIDDQITRTTHLNIALESRITIEQAKGIVAEHRHIGVDDAFTLIRRYSRDKGRLLHDTARSIIDGTVRPARLDHGRVVSDTESPSQGR